jgi:hypothetical protein
MQVSFDDFNLFGKKKPSWTIAKVLARVSHQWDKSQSKKMCFLCQFWSFGMTYCMTRQTFGGSKESHSDNEYAHTIKCDGDQMVFGSCWLLSTIFSRLC